MDNTYDNIVNRLSQTTERINNKKTVVEEKKGEEPAKCYSPDEIDDYSTKIIQTGEVCTIETAKEYQKDAGVLFWVLGRSGSYEYKDGKITLCD